MAVNTRNRRVATVQLAMPWMHLPPVPDGSLANAADRTHLGHAYPGLPALGGRLETWEWRLRPAEDVRGNRQVLQRQDQINQAIAARIAALEAKVDV